MSLKSGSYLMPKVDKLKHQKVELSLKFCNIPKCNYSKKIKVFANPCCLLSHGRKIRNSFILSQFFLFIFFLKNLMCL